MFLLTQSVANHVFHRYPEVPTIRELLRLAIRCSLADRGELTPDRGPAHFRHRPPSANFSPFPQHLDIFILSTSVLPRSWTQSRCVASECNSSWHRWLLHDLIKKKRSQVTAPSRPCLTLQSVLESPLARYL